MGRERELLIDKQTEERKRERLRLDDHLEKLNREYKAQLERDNLEKEESIRKEGEEALIQVLTAAGEERKALEAEKAKLQEERNSWHERALRFNQELQRSKRNNNPPSQAPLIPPFIPPPRPVKKEPVSTPPISDPQCIFSQNSNENDINSLSPPIDEKELHLLTSPTLIFPLKH